MGEPVWGDINRFCCGADFPWVDVCYHRSGRGAAYRQHDRYAGQCSSYRDVPAARSGGCFSSQVGVGGDPTLCVWPVYIVNWAVYSIMP